MTVEKRPNNTHEDDSLKRVPLRKQSNITCQTHSLNSCLFFLVTLIKFHPFFGGAGWRIGSVFFQGVLKFKLVFFLFVCILRHFQYLYLCQKLSLTWNINPVCVGRWWVKKCLFPRGNNNYFLTMMQWLHSLSDCRFFEKFITYKANEIIST